MATRGRQLGSRNKTRALTLARVPNGIMPIEFMLDVLRNEDAPMEERKWAANAAAPYVHPRLSAVEAKVDVDAKVTEIRRTIVDNV